jgi:putative ABC transport system permease protein
VKKYGFTDVLDKEMSGMGKVIGVMEDFNFESLRVPVRPIAFMINKNYPNMINFMLIRINGANTRRTLDYVRDMSKQFSSKPVDTGFMDEWHHLLYKQENNLAKLISIFSVITVIVTIMGVYGLILFNVKLKRKTIAIHKINGASVKDIIIMLNRGFIAQFSIAYIIAVAFAYIIVNSWLENFAYKTPLHWWIFVFGGILVFIITILTVSYQSYRAATTNPVEGIRT